MPTSSSIAIADALAAGLSAYSFSSPYADITATRRYVADDDALALKNVKVSVVPGPTVTERGARGSDDYRHQLAVIIAKQTAGTNAELDALGVLAEEILDAIRSDLITYGPTMPENARYLGAEMETVLDRDSIADRSLFLTQILCTYHHPRAKLEAAP